MSYVAISRRKDLLATGSVRSAITVGELAGQPHLRLRVLAGHDGLDRRVQTAHVVDFHRPWDWLDPGDLLLTSGWMIPVEGPAQADFIERSHAAGFSGLIVGEDKQPEPVAPPLTAAMLEAADRYRFPLLRAEYSVPWDVVFQAVTAASESEEKNSLNHIMRIHNEVRLSLSERRSSAEFIAGMAGVLGCELYLIECALPEPVLPGCGVPDQAWQAALTEALAQRLGKVPTVIHLKVDDQVGLVTPVPVELSVFLLTIPRADPGPRVAVLQHVAAACALEMTRVDAGFERDRRSGAALVTEALHGRLDSRVLDSSLVDRGITSPCLCIAIQAAQETVDRLERRWSLDGVPHLLSGMGPTYIGILNSDDAVIDNLTKILAAGQYRVGISDPFSGAGGLIDGARQARWALETVHHGGNGVARYGNDGHALLPRTLSEARLAAERILEPVLDYDRVHGTELVRTLRTYLQCDRSPKRAARLLFVHNQTVNYRISRIEELTGRSMRSTADISELWFGLRALALSDSSEPQG
jgi:PucR family transcriptional regulator, purine catabolism regulatory protein